MGSFLAVVTFDIIETLDSFGIAVIPFTFTETPPFSENFEELGYEVSNTVSLMGTVNILILFMTGIFLLTLVVKICKPCCQNTKFGRKVRTKFTFKGQLETLNRLIITGSLEILVCSIVTVFPSKMDLPIYTEMPYDEMPGIDKFAMIYGIVILGIFSLMVIVYTLVIIYLAPKILIMAVQK